jgi:hypothetical protein
MDIRNNKNSYYNFITCDLLYDENMHGFACAIERLKNIDKITKENIVILYLYFYNYDFSEKKNL